jgi:nuclear transport factor 2 (NTF2) superfamily protein
MSSTEIEVNTAGRNPQTFEEASRLVKYVESLFMPWDFDALLAGFTDDCIVRYAEFPEMHGKEELDKFFRGRALRQKDYWLKKDLGLLMGDMIANTWNCGWIDLQTGKNMWG